MSECRQDSHAGEALILKCRRLAVVFFFIFFHFCGYVMCGTLTCVSFDVQQFEFVEALNCVIKRNFIKDIT